MNMLSQAFDFEKLQQNPKPAAIPSNVESCSDNAALSDDDLELVSAAGDATVPTMHPDVLLGRHDIPADTRENKP